MEGFNEAMEALGTDKKDLHQAHRCFPRLARAFSSWCTNKLSAQC